MIRTDAFYAALEEEPTNPNLLASLAEGLEAVVLHCATPPSVPTLNDQFWSAVICFIALPTAYTTSL
jgi:hypothetical protein